METALQSAEVVFLVVQLVGRGPEGGRAFRRKQRRFFSLRSTLCRTSHVWATRLRHGRRRLGGGRRKRRSGLPFVLFVLFVVLGEHCVRINACMRGFKGGGGSGDLQSKASPSAMSFALVTPPGSPTRSLTPCTPLDTPPSTPDLGPAAALSEPATPRFDRGPDMGLGCRQLLGTTDPYEQARWSAWKCAEAARRESHFDWFVDFYRRAAFSDAGCGEHERKEAMEKACFALLSYMRGDAFFVPSCGRVPGESLYGDIAEYGSHPFFQLLAACVASDAADDVRARLQGCVAVDRRAWRCAEHGYARLFSSAWMEWAAAVLRPGAR